jgi:hypothetical protein
VLLEQQAVLKNAVDPATFALYLDLDATVGAILDVFGTRVWEAGWRARKG